MFSYQTAPFTPESILLSPNESITIRLLEPSDASKLIDYFNGLSTQTKSYFGQHSFDPETVATLCTTLNPGTCIRLIATSANNQTIVAYLLLQSGATPSDTARYKALGININTETDCSLAPSIADAYQSRQLGGDLMAKAPEIAREMTKKRIILGVVCRLETNGPFCITENTALFKLLNLNTMGLITTCIWNTDRV